MDVKQAERVQPGDVVTYLKSRRQVISVSHAGLWSPYFELDDEGVVSHSLVELADAGRANGMAERSAAD
jgi:hypothetical protein